jgi:hypothetical protein
MAYSRAFSMAMAALEAIGQQFQVLRREDSGLQAIVDVDHTDRRPFELERDTQDGAQPENPNAGSAAEPRVGLGVTGKRCTPVDGDALDHRAEPDRAPALQPCWWNAARRVAASGSRVRPIT